jgi:hypothetical protein
MDSFLGLPVAVKLNHAPNAIVYGIVREAVPDSHLMLSGGM